MRTLCFFGRRRRRRIGKIVQIGCRVDLHTRNGRTDEPARSDFGRSGRRTIQLGGNIRDANIIPWESFVKIEDPPNNGGGKSRCRGYAPECLGFFFCRGEAL